MTNYNSSFSSWYILTGRTQLKMSLLPLRSYCIGILASSVITQTNSLYRRFQIANKSTAFSAVW